MPAREKDRRVVVWVQRPRWTGLFKLGLELRVLHELTVLRIFKVLAFRVDGCQPPFGLDLLQERHVETQSRDGSSRKARNR